MKTSATGRLRIIGTVFGLLSLVGAYDYIMILTNNADYFEYLGYGDRQIAYFTGYPAALMLLLTTAVLGTVIGSILLLRRSRWAALAFGAAFFVQLVLDIYTFAARDRWDILGPRLSIQDLSILFLTLGMLIYSVSLHKKQVIH